MLATIAPEPSPLPPASLPPDTTVQTDVTEPLAIPVVGREEDRGPEFQRSKALFFFRLERELEKVLVCFSPRNLRSLKVLNLQINSFYLQKEAELKLRLATLLSKRRAAKQRSAANIDGSLETQGVEWAAVNEGFNSLNKDLSKLQVSYCVTRPLGTQTDVSPRNSNSSS